MYKNIHAIKQANKRINHHFFDKGNMLHADSIVYSDVYKVCYFITSECDIEGKNRRFSIRKCLENGTISTISKYREYETLEQAKQNIPME